MTFCFMRNACVQLGKVSARRQSEQLDIGTPSFRTWPAIYRMLIMQTISKEDFWLDELIFADPFLFFLNVYMPFLYMMYIIAMCLNKA